MQVRKQKLELDMEQLTGSKLGKEYVKAAGIDPSPALLVDSLPLSLQGSHELNFIPQQQQKRIPFFSLHLYYQNCIEVLLYFEFSRHNFCARLFPLQLPIPTPRIFLCPLGQKAGQTHLALSREVHSP